MVTECDNKTPFRFWFTVDTLKMMAGDYKISIAAKSVARFEGTNVPTNYWVALEADSTYGKA